MESELGRRIWASGFISYIFFDSGQREGSILAKDGQEVEFFRFPRRLNVLSLVCSM